jgi:hypothetical protein
VAHPPFPIGFLLLAARLSRLTRHPPFVSVRPIRGSLPSQFSCLPFVPSVSFVVHSPFPNSSFVILISSLPHPSIPPFAPFVSFVVHPPYCLLPTAHCPMIIFAKTRGKTPLGCHTSDDHLWPPSVAGSSNLPAPPDGHLWMNPGEKRPVGVTPLMAIYGRDGHLWPLAPRARSTFPGRCLPAQTPQKPRTIPDVNMDRPAAVLGD